MKKSHLDYLRRMIGKAISGLDRDDISEGIMRVKSPSTGIHRMVRDIVCDARFYSVLDGDAFWKSYGQFRIAGFIDSISPEEWESEECRTMLKEAFLNEWMAANMMPISDERRREIEAGIRLRMSSGDASGMPDPEDHDGTSLGEILLGDGIKDATHRTGVPAEGLPPNLKDYMEDCHGGNSPGKENNSHQADSRFMARIHPSIVELAEKIGRRGAREAERRGRFRFAPKSDISGVSVGDDLNSLLPSEIALMGDPESERIFLDRFARKRLQIFSSVSRTSRKDKDIRGPVFICLDTSGSMTGIPEEMAKTLALAISIVAQKERRPVCIFNYSFSISFFLLKNIRTQRGNLLRFLSDSYGGGNDENRLIDLIFRKMPLLARYRGLTGDLEGADMLVVSDFRWIGLNPEMSELLGKAAKAGMRIFSVGVDPDMPLSSGMPSGEEFSGFLSGHRFFRMSDHRYVFEEGMIKEKH